MDVNNVKEYSSNSSGNKKTGSVFVVDPNPPGMDIVPPEDLFIYVVHLLKMGNKVYVCGLDGDFQRKKFGQILDLIPLCDKVTKLTSLCSICKNGKQGIFSMRLTVETCQTLVGSDNYIPVCRDCYDNNHTSNNNY
jgi:thymidine kinase